MITTFRIEEQDKPELNGDELSFKQWCEEAVAAGILADFLIHPYTFELIPKGTIRETVQMKTKTKQVDRHVHHPHRYTPDAMLTLTPEGLALLKDVKTFKLSCKVFQDQAEQLVLYIDVKASFVAQHGQSQMFSANQKLMWQAGYGWVAKVVPKNLFAETWVPEQRRWKKNRKKPTLTKVGEQCLTIDQFINK
jgi:hypothetical protein